MEKIIGSDLVVLPPINENTCPSCFFNSQSGCLAHKKLSANKAIYMCRKAGSYKPHDMWLCPECNKAIKLTDEKCLHCGNSFITGNTLKAVVASIFVILGTIILGVSVAAWLDLPSNKMHFFMIISLIMATIMWSVVKRVYFSLKRKKILQKARRYYTMN